MVYAYIKSQGGEFIGTVNQESSGFRVYWRDRTADNDGNAHTASTALHAAFESARQEVYKADPTAMVMLAKK